uniref:Uncharacterized protein n=1 Tax=Picea glauca TaxID=3330 RepID=A0A101LUV8_PICGL|nr:hypothetical protein ABT39_MTgene2360 [Picea glauca]
MLLLLDTVEHNHRFTLLRTTLLLVDRGTYFLFMLNHISYLR